MRKVSRLTLQHPVFALARNGRCSCVCGCSHVLSRHEMDEVGDWCDACFDDWSEACFDDRSHRPTRQGSPRSFDTDPTPPHGIRRPTEGMTQ